MVGGWAGLGHDYAHDLDDYAHNLGTDLETDLGLGGLNWGDRLARILQGRIRQGIWEVNLETDVAINVRRARRDLEFDREEIWVSTYLRQAWDRCGNDLGIDLGIDLGTIWEATWD